jgi:hypothetical protein
MSVRWDAVVTRHTFLSPSRGSAAAATAPEPAGQDGPVEIRVRLFGMLVGPEVTNPMVLQFARGCALQDVMQELGRRLGPQVMRNLVGENGRSFNTCRLFLDGEPVEDMATRISRKGPAAPTVEIILFREIEGG